MMPVEMAISGGASSAALTSADMSFGVYRT